MAEVIQPGAPSLSRRDQTVATLFGLWMIIGLFLDGWAHDNQKPESFFTPWHGVLYSGFGAAALFAIERSLRHRQPGRPWREAVPIGHGLTLAALSMFAVGAFGDLVWHEVLGIEVGVEALLSPTHLLLLASGLVALSAPIRSAWSSTADGGDPSMREFLPVALSSALLTALLAFFLLYLSPFSNDAAGTAFTRFQGQIHEHPSTDVAELQQLLGVASILMTSVVLAAPIAFLLRRWRPPAGTFTLVFTLLVVLFEGVAEFAHPPVILAGVVAGLLADALVRRHVAIWNTCAATVAALWLSYSRSTRSARGRWRGPQSCGRDRRSSGRCSPPASVSWRRPASGWKHATMPPPPGLHRECWHAEEPDGCVRRLTGVQTRKVWFRVLFDAAGGPLVTYATRRVPAGDVDDVVADVLTVAWRRLDDVPDGAGALPCCTGRPAACSRTTDAAPNAESASSTGCDASPPARALRGVARACRLPSPRSRRATRAAITSVPNFFAPAAVIDPTVIPDAEGSDDRPPDLRARFPDQ